MAAEVGEVGVTIPCRSPAFLPGTVLNHAVNVQQYIISLFNSLSLHHERQCLGVYIYSF